MPKGGGIPGSAGRRESIRVFGVGRGWGLSSPGSSVSAGEMTPPGEEHRDGAAMGSLSSSSLGGGSWQVPVKDWNKGEKVWSCLAYYRLKCYVKLLSKTSPKQSSVG